jgi:hypothetical protein
MQICRQPGLSPLTLVVVVVVVVVVVGFAGIGHSGAVTMVQISPDQSRIVSVGAEGAILFWSSPPELSRDLKAGGYAPRVRTTRVPGHLGMGIGACAFACASECVSVGFAR